MPGNRGYFKIVEKVPVQFVRRGGDWVQEGGNNTLIVLGTDRAAPDGPATIDDGLGTVDAEGGGKGAGTIAIVAGRQDLEGGNLDINNDDTTLYLSRKTKVDDNLGTTFETQDTGPAAVLVSDYVRFVFRQNMKISSQLSATNAFLDGDHLHIDMQGKAKVSLDIDGDASSCKIDVQDNFIEIKSDGTVTVTSKDKVTVNCKTAEVHGTTSVTVDTPKVDIVGPGNTTIEGTLTVGGLASFNAPGLSLKTAANAAVGAIALVGGISGPSAGAPIPGGLNTDGDVKSSGDVSTGVGSLNQHTHITVGVKAGPDAVNTMNIGASAAKNAEIAAAAAAAAAAAEAARKAAEEEARRQAEAQAAADAAAAAAANDNSYSGG